jgi:hypothetical protein
MDERPEVPPLELEQWLLSEQTGAQRSRTEARLEPARRAALRGEDEALRARLFARLPPARFVAQVVAKARETELPARASGRRQGLYQLSAFATAAAALALVLWTWPARELGTSDSEERAKGLALELRVHRKTPDGSERLSDGAQARAHDVLQLGYVRDSYAFGVLLSIDGRGGVTLHHPSHPAGTTELAKQRGPQLLPEAYELDDAPDFERFIFVAADRPLSVEAVRAAASALAQSPARARREPLPLSVPAAQRSLLLNKSEAR